MTDDKSEMLETREQAFARIPKDQRFTWEITPLPGRLLFAETIGNSLACLKDIFASIHPGGVVVSVLNCGFRKSGAFFADLTVMPVQDEPPAKPEAE